MYTLSSVSVWTKIKMNCFFEREGFDRSGNTIKTFICLYNFDHFHCHLNQNSLKSSKFKQKKYILEFTYLLIHSQCCGPLLAS